MEKLLQSECSVIMIVFNVLKSLYSRVLFVKLKLYMFKAACDA